jgi:hypothetical protein
VAVVSDLLAGPPPGCEAYGYLLLERLAEWLSVARAAATRRRLFEGDPWMPAAAPL